MKLVISVIFLLLCGVVSANNIHLDLEVLRAESKYLSDHHPLRNIPTANRINSTIAEMELMIIRGGDHFVVVNLELQNLIAISHDIQILQRKVIIGKPATPTPILEGTIQEITFNPTWTVPRSITADFLENMQRSNGIWAGYNIYDLDNNKIPTLSAVPLQYYIVQSPGIWNALGYVKIDFNNKFGIFLHDTKNKLLFDSDIRQFSEGCIRVQHPDGLVSFIMDITAEELQKIKQSTHTTKHAIIKDIRVFVVDWDVWVGQDGAIRYK